MHYVLYTCNSYRLIEHFHVLQDLILFLQDSYALLKSYNDLTRSYKIRVRIFGWAVVYTGKKIVFRTLGSVPSNVFNVVLGTLNTFDGIPRKKSCNGLPRHTKS